MNPTPLQPRSVGPRSPDRQRLAGIAASLASAAFLGLAPIFGKRAILLGMPPLGVVAARTLIAAALLALTFLIFQRRFFYIYPAGLLGCLLAGGINGAGSLLYYAALGRIPASLGQPLYALYPLFVAIWLYLDGQPLKRLTLLRLVIVIPAVVLLVAPAANSPQQLDTLGVWMMLASAALYALHIPINQRVLYDMPAPTVTLYTLIAMSAIVVPAYLISAPGRLTGASGPAASGISAALDVLLQTPQAWWPVLWLALVTFSSRLMLFMGVKNLGSLQTALLGLGELLVTILVAQLWLAETFTLLQWFGAALLILGLGLVLLDKTPPVHRAPLGTSGQSPSRSGRLLGWLRPPGLPRDFPWPPE